MGFHVCSLKKNGSRMYRNEKMAHRWQTGWGLGGGGGDKCSLKIFLAPRAVCSEINIPQRLWRHFPSALIIRISLMLQPLIPFPSQLYSKSFPDVFLVWFPDLSVLFYNFNILTFSTWDDICLEVGYLVLPFTVQMKERTGLTRYYNMRQTQLSSVPRTWT